MHVWLLHATDQWDLALQPEVAKATALMFDHVPFPQRESELP